LAKRHAYLAKPRSRWSAVFAFRNTKWQQIKEDAKNDADPIRADVEIKRLERTT
jgi:hypothetical protein